MDKLFTIGHSTLGQDEFIKALKAHGIQQLIDIRSHPGSRYMPHFNRENMQVWLPKSGIEYLHMPNLGGRRRNIEGVAQKDIEGWKNISFRNYGAYTLTDEFSAALKELANAARKQTVCIMCAESVPWRCHRLLVSNSITQLGFEVYHILSADSAKLHELNRYGAKVVIDNDRVTYPK